MFLGIDLGTSEVKTLLVDDVGKVVGVASQLLDISRPNPRWSEQAPEDWWVATLGAVGKLREQYPAQLSAVRGVGLSGQMHGATLLDSSDRPLRPAILWNDTRSDIECQDLIRRVPNAPAITGNLAMPGFTAPKLIWVAKNEPDIFRRVATVLLPKDYLRLRLTGSKISEMSDAAGTLWLDVGRRDWSDKMLEACQLSRAQMPKLVEGSAPGGTLLPEIAQAWGIKHSVTVAGGGGDNAATAVGIGAVQPGSGFASLGTSGVLFVVNDRFLPNPAGAVHAFCHAVPRRWHQMSVMLSAASCLRWVTQLVGGENEAAVLSEVESLNETARATAPIFLPYLSGERTPHNDSKAQGVFFGLTHGTERAALVYSVIEGVAFGLADGLAALKAVGTDVQTLSLVGGGSRSGYWAQLIANVLDVKLRIHSGGETGAAMGAARLAQLACGAREEDVCRSPPVVREYQPSLDADEPINERLARFRRLYKAVAPIWKETD